MAALFLALQQGGEAIGQFIPQFFSKQVIIFRFVRSGGKKCRGDVFLARLDSKQ